jgi:thiol-disulfide isomerase/thioredoxin
MQFFNQVTRVGLIIFLIAASTVLPITFAHSDKTPADEELSQVFLKVNEHIHNQQYNEAIKELKAASQARDNKNPECLDALGRLYIKQKDYRNAADTLRILTVLKPANEAEVINMLGVVLYLQSDKTLYAEAASAFQKAIDLSGGKMTKAYHSLGYALIRSGKEKEGVAALKKYLEINTSASNAEEVRKVIANPKIAQEYNAPKFKVKSITGEEISLEKYRGKIVLIDFWATWCPPCREEMPHIKEIAAKYAGNDNFVIIGINMDADRDALKKYLKSENITWSQYFDGGGWENKISRLYGITSIPNSVIVDQNGVMRAAGLRGDQISDKIDEMLMQLPK